MESAISGGLISIAIALWLGLNEIAIQLIRECRALEDIEEGRIKEAITKCKSRWASFPGAGYGQKEYNMEALLKVYDGYLRVFKDNSPA